jgi:hypothetical protein
MDSIKSISYELEVISEEIDKLFNIKSMHKREIKPISSDFFSQNRLNDSHLPRFNEVRAQEDPPKEFNYSPKSNYSEDPANFSVHSKFFANPQKPVPQPRNIEEFYNNPRKVDEPISLVKETKPKGLGFFNRNAPPYF